MLYIVQNILTISVRRLYSKC